jgi:hypothetical protein
MIRQDFTHFKNLGFEPDWLDKILTSQPSGRPWTLCEVGEKVPIKFKFASFKNSSKSKF